MAQWEVKFNRNVFKKLEFIPKSIQHKTIALMKSIEIQGPIQDKYLNFSKLKNRKVETYHCHLKKGKPTYVAIWTVVENQVIIEYIGTHEKAPY